MTNRPGILGRLCYHATAELNFMQHFDLSTRISEEMNMPKIRNISRTKIILEHLKDEPIVINPNETIEVPAEALSLPLVRHYIQVKRLDLVGQQPRMANVVLSR